MEDIAEAYEIKDILGEGSFAKVYKGLKLSDGSVHALKVLQTSHFKDFEIHLLHGETSVMQSADHPNLVRCIECFESKDEVIIAMEMLEGALNQ